MKKSHIFLILVIAVAIALVISTGNDASTYVTFKDAHQMASNGNSSQIHVVGELKKDNLGNVVGIYEGADKVSFTFIMIDDQQKEQIVQYNQPMPADFTKSEKVVVIGSYQGDNFIAEKILLKCPSKYQEDTINA
ncbi:cytochrome c biogenesis protein [Chryseotalea sanaruensis]|uniref:Cytochrome c biogenesis protein n=1 Tax=Chryseotalea sanaruensis TaxID=2482724 RepID=A0A401UC42_9BACT|nr:cytochrome c maturation protein CcmE [Chryseotalea sanaruensis]GCC52447.1 cytochrome c biogenesis protein [Chryseotalea sanaruensis]